MDRVKEILTEADNSMQDSVAFLEEDLKTYRVGKANPAILNNVMVSYYGTLSPISQVASVSVPDAKTIMVQPWEKSMLSVIEKAIMDANLGLTPQNNGDVIRCPIPPLTEERRRDLTKQAKAAGEDAKVSVRNARRDSMDLFKKAEKNEGLSEDLRRDGEEKLQEITDKHIEAIDKLVDAKQQEIITV